jgi:hypothetical protein
VESSLPPVESPPQVLFWYLAFFIVCVLIVATVISFVFATPRQRRRLLLTLLALTCLLAAAAWIVSNGGEAGGTDAEATPLPVAGEIPPGVSEERGAEAPPEDFMPPPVSPWLSFGVAFGLLALAALLAWLFLGRRAAGVPLEALAGIARETISELQAGREYGDAAIECYARMTATVAERRGLKLRAHMTAAEFAAVLERSRLPGDAVRRLTVLFERVRYGGRRSTRQDVDEALACLAAIADGCKEAL